MALISDPNRPAFVIPRPKAYTCTPSSLMASSPCLACFSDKELLVALVAILIAAKGTTVDQVMKDSACFTCLTKKQMKQGFVTIMGNELLGEASSQDAILALMRCLRCANDTQLNAAALYLICQLTISTGQ